MVVVAVCYWVAWFWLSSEIAAFHQLPLVDRVLCPVTFISCLNPSRDGGSWQMLLAVNGIALLVWTLFLAAAHGFIFGQTWVRQILGLAVSVFIPVAILAVFVLGLLISSIS
jgi:hypothetical protein